MRTSFPPAGPLRALLTVSTIALNLVARADIPMTLDTTYSGTIAIPGQSHSFTFEGAAGQRLYLDSLTSDNVNLSVTILTPSHAALFSRHKDYDDGPFVLTEPGTYTIVIDGNGPVTGNYEFRMLDLSAGAPLTLGTTVSGQLSPRLACVVYQFAGTRGKRVNLQSISAAANQAQWQLLTPANAVLASGQISQSLGTVTLPMDGPYFVLVSGTASGATPLGFQFRLSDVSDAPPGATTGFATAHSGTISSGQTNAFSVTGPAGLPIYFDSLDISGQSLVVDLIDPFGVSVFNVSETADAGPYVLPRSGTYSLQVRAYNNTASGNYNFRLLDLSSSPALSMNAPVSASLVTPYQAEVYKLSGSPGQRLLYDAVDSDFDNVQVRLVQPDGQLAISGNADQDRGPVTLPASGSYYLILLSGLSTSPDYAFRMFDVSAQPLLPLDTDITGTLAANSSSVYRFSATNGAHLYFNGKGVNSGGAGWILYGPNDVSQGSAAIGNDFEPVFSVTGTYVVALYGGSSPVTFTNEVNTFSYLTNSLTLGSQVSGSIVKAGQRITYTFAGSVGQRLYYDSLNAANNSINVSLISPSGGTVFTANAITDRGPITLLESGTYSLVVDGSSAATGEFGFQLLDASVQPVLPVNVDLTGTLQTNFSKVYRLAGAAGDHLYFDGKGNNGGGAAWYFYTPDNLTASGAALANDFELTLNSPGEYLLVMSGGSTPLNYTNQVVTFGYATNALVLSAPVTGTIARPGDQVHYTFTGTVGQRVYFDSLTTANNSINATLLDPTGASVFTVNAISDHGPAVLTLAGTYDLVLNANGASTGEFKFQMFDVGAQPALSLNSDLVGTLQTNTSRLFVLPGTAGGRYFFDGKGVNGGGATWYLYGPDNLLVSGTSLAGDFEETLPAAGNYVLVLSGGSTVLAYTNQVNTITYATNSVSLGTRTTSSIAKPGDRITYTFQGAVGQRLYYDSRQTTSSSILATLTDPAGSAVFSQSASQDFGPFTLLHSGEYSLTFDGSGQATGSISFNLLDLANVSALSFGATSGTLEDQTEAKLYRIAGTAGQRLNLQHTSASANQAVWELVGADDLNLGSAGINADIGVRTLPVTGVFGLLISGTGTAGTPLSFQVNVTDVTDAPPGATTGFGLAHSGTISSGQTNAFSITGPAGLPVYLDSLDNSGQSLVVDLIDPAGAAVFTVTETSDAGPYVLPRSGTYSLQVRAYNNTASGNYNFRLLDLTGSPALQLDQATTNGVAADFQTDLYRFTGSVSQRLFFDGVTTDANYPSVAVQLFSTTGTLVWQTSSFQNDSGPILLKHDDTYYLALKRSKTSASNYRFVMINLASQDPLPVNSTVTNVLAAYQSRVYRLSGTAGRRFYFDGQAGNPSGSWAIYDADNIGLPAGNASLTGDFEVTLPADGTYALLLNNLGTSGTNVFIVTDFSFPTGSLTLGTPVTGVISEPGEQRIFTVTGTLGQRLYYDSLTNDPPAPNAINIQFLNPRGTAIPPISGRFTTDRGPFTLQESGTYTVVLDGTGNSTGTFAMVLLDLAGQPIVPINVPVTNILAGYQSKVFRLSGSAGQRLYFNGQTGNPSGTWALYNPDDASVGSGSLAGDFELTLPADGTYALVLNNGATAGTNVFEINDYLFFTSNYVVGNPVVSALTVPGEQRIYTFTGAAGQRLYYDALTNDPPAPSAIDIQLLNPQGQTVSPIGGRFTIDRGPFTLQVPGTYTLILDGSGAGTGALAFAMMDVAAQPILPINTLVTNVLASYQTAIYRFSGIAGQHVYFDGRPGNPSGSSALYDPLDNLIPGTSVGLSGDFEATLPSDGTYALMLINGAAAGPCVFEVNPFNSGETLLVNRAPVLTPVPAQTTGEGNLLNFTVTANDPDGNSLTYSLDPGAPAGATINPSSGLFSWTPPPTGFSLVTNVIVRATDNGTPILDSAQIVSIAVIAGPVMITVDKSETDSTVYWRSAPGKHYQMQFKNGLRDANWTDIGSLLAATNFISSQVDATVGTNSMRFYRVHLLDPD